MHRLITFVILLLTIYLRLSSSDADSGDDYNEDFYADGISSISSTTITTKILETNVEEIVENITEVSLVTTTIINDEITKSFFAQYFLNVNRSVAPSDLTLKNYFNDSLLLTIGENELFLISKIDGTIRKEFQYGHVIPIKPSNYLVIYDDNTQELGIIDAIDQKYSRIPFKPKQIFISPFENNIWIAETNDQLYISEDSGANWKKIDESSGSIVLGWSNKTKSLIILQHSHYLKLLDLTNLQMSIISNDVQSAKLFSRYLVIKRLNVNNSISISHVNNLADNGFRSLPNRFQSQGNFYCAVEDIYTQDLLFLFMTEDRVGDNNETVLSTCQLVSYAKQKSFSLSDIDCARIKHGNSPDTIECSKDQIPLYQVRGLSKSVYIVNIGSGPTTVVSFDDGISWNRTQYECDRTINCPSNASIVISSLISSEDAPGILLGKATNGINEYVAISTNGGRQWRLNFKNKNYSTVLSNPNAFLLAVPSVNQQTLEHSFRYSTDYGRHWYDESFLNETSFQILSVIADQNNFFYLLTLNDQNQLGLIQLDLNYLIPHRCGGYQLKEWSLHNACINGSKLHYKRRVPGSRCLEENVEIRSEPCTCSLIDFECAPGYKRSSDGVCLPKSQFTSSQDCTCDDTNNSTRSARRRGYVKSENSQCISGVESYLTNAYVSRRDPHQPNLLIYGVNSRTQRPTIEIHGNDFNQNDNDDDEDEDSSENLAWILDPNYDITAVTFDETGQQFYIAAENQQFAIIYKINKNLRQQNHYARQLIFDANNELFKSVDDRIEYLTMDWLAQNLYILLRNRSNRQQSIIVFDLRTRKRRTIVKDQQIQPSILLIDPSKTELYWITQNSPSILNIGNLQGELKKRIQLSSLETNVTYFSYDPISHELIYVIDSNIYGLNTLNYRQASPKIIYDHSANIENALFVHPILYFTSRNDQTESGTIQLNAIDILAKSFAKNIAKFKDLNALKLFVDMAPTMPTGTIANRCATNPCSDLCIPLEHERFRCICSDDARYQSCSCPTDERFVAGSCQAKNGQCAPGRIICQNRLNCAESARICELDHTQYTDEFKSTARCTIDQPNDGFDCYYPIHGTNNTCIPFQWLCDGDYDCPLGNDEEHCHKLTTTVKTISKSNQCLTSNKYTHIMCGNQCIKIEDVCQNTSNIVRCADAFHRHCKQTNDRNLYDCKCFDADDRCIAMADECDDYESCDRICQASIREANSIANRIRKTSSFAWIVLAVAILAILIIAIIIITIRYRRRTKNLTNTATASRTPDVVETNDVPPNETRERLLNNGRNAANETN